MRAAGVPHVVFDLEAERLVGPTGLILYDISRHQDGCRLELPAGEAVVAVLHASPCTVNRIRVSGGARLVLLTRPEREGQVGAWHERLLRTDEVWVPIDDDGTVLREEGIAAERIRVLPSSLDPAVAVNQRSGLGLAANRFRFLVTTRAMREPELVLVVEAFLEAFSAEDDVSMIVLVEDGRELPSLRAAINARLTGHLTLWGPNTPYVVFARWTPGDERRWDAYSSCDVFVASATSESGWGLAVREAMALQKLVLAIDPDDSGELHTHANSLLVKPGSVADAMRAVAADSSAFEARRRQGAQDVAERHGHQEIGNRLLEILCGYRNCEFVGHEPPVVDIGEGPRAAPRGPAAINAEEAARRPSQLDLHEDSTRAES